MNVFYISKMIFSQRVTESLWLSAARLLGTVASHDTRRCSLFAPVLDVERRFFQLDCQSFSYSKDQFVVPFYKMQVCWECSLVSGVLLLTSLLCSSMAPDRK